MKNISKIILVMVVLSSSICLFAQENISQQYGNTIMYNVSVVGAVKNPGVYMLPSTTRVSEAIKIANISNTKNEIESVEIENAIMDSLRLEKNIKPSKRNIILNRKDKEQHLDIERFLVLGDKSQNPYIIDGDVIIVPIQKEHVEICGAIGKLNGYIELIPGDKIADIIELTFGLQPNADLANVEIVRFIDNSSNYETFTVDVTSVLENQNSEKNIFLKNDDRIYFRELPKYHEKCFVTLMGEIKYPGIYAIDNNKTTLMQIIVKAGGPTDDTDLSNSYLQRISEEDIRESEYNELEKIRDFEMDYIEPNISHLEYQYYVNKLIEEKHIFSKNFKTLWNDKNIEYDISLKDGDVIYFPAKVVVVRISGEVANPGLINHILDLNYIDYIELAGGLTDTAWKRKVKIIRAKTGEWIKPNKETQLYPGDTIFVPRKERFSYYWPYIKETISFITGLATSIIVIKSLMAN